MRNGPDRAGSAIAIVKARPRPGDRVCMMLADGTSRQLAVHVVHDLPHLVVESWFGIEDGLWGVLARGGFSDAHRARTRRRGRPARMVTDAPLDDLAQANWLGHVVAKAATNAVVNRWQEGPDTAAAVRTRLESSSPPADVDAGGYRHRIGELLRHLDDETITLAITGTRQLYALWDRLPPGGTLRLQWPLPRARQQVISEPGQWRADA